MAAAAPVVSSPVLVVASAADCGHCVSMYKWWPQARSKLEGMGIRVVEIKFPSRGSGLPDGYPKALKPYIPHFPSVSLFKGQDYDNAVSKGTALSGHIFGGYVDSSGFHDLSSGEFGFNPDGIANWASNIITINNWPTKSPLLTQNASTSIKPLISAGHGSVLSGHSGQLSGPPFGGATKVGTAKGGMVPNIGSCSGGLNIIARKW